MPDGGRGEAAGPGPCLPRILMTFSAAACHPSPPRGAHAAVRREEPGFSPLVSGRQVRTEREPGGGPPGLSCLDPWLLCLPLFHRTPTAAVTGQDRRVCASRPPTALRSNPLPTTEPSLGPRAVGGLRH